MMKVIATFDGLAFLDTVLSLVLAFALGTLIGVERQYRQRTAGLRTNVLVALGAAAFVDLGMRLTGGDGAVRVTAYVVSGVGFLGAGVIMKEGMNVRGLNTAATLWSSAAVGAFCGSDMPAEAILLATLIIVGNTLLRPLVNAINRAPFDTRASEATYELQVTAEAADLARVRREMVARLLAAQYPVSDVDVVERADDCVEVVATLVSTAVDPKELDAVVTHLAARPDVRDATWSARTAD